MNSTRFLEFYNHSQLNDYNKALKIPRSYSGTPTKQIRKETRDSDRDRNNVESVLRPVSPPRPPTPPPTIERCRRPTPPQSEPINELVETGTEIDTTKAKLWSKMITEALADQDHAFFSYTFEKFLSQNSIQFVTMAISYISLDQAQLLKSRLEGIPEFERHLALLFPNLVWNTIELRNRLSQIRSITTDYADDDRVIDVYPVDAESGERLIYNPRFFEHHLDASEKIHLLNRPPYVSSPMIAQTLKQFKVNLDIFTKGTLKDIAWTSKDGTKTQVLLCGGAVVSSLQHIGHFERHQAIEEFLAKLPAYPRSIVREELGVSTYEQIINNMLEEDYCLADIDLLLVAESEDEARIKMAELIEQILPRIPTTVNILRTPFSVTILPRYPYRPIQIITSLVRSRREHLLLCDMDCTAFTYDGTTVHTMPRGINAFNKRVNHVGPLDWGRASKRAFKYSRRGFSIVIFELCKHPIRCDLPHNIKDNWTRSEMYDDFDGGLPYGEHLSEEEILEKLASGNISGVPAILFDDTAKALEAVDFQWKYKYAMRRGVACYQCQTMMRDGQFGAVNVCGNCRKLNESKWTQWDDLPASDKPRYALVTGGRIKIGFQSALRLLKSGFHVLVTSRFAHSTVAAYRAQPDYEEWADRLQVYAIDLRHLPSVGALINHINTTFPRLDVLINNAAQTIRRPRAYYHTLRVSEKRLAAIEGAADRHLLDNAVVGEATDNGKQLARASILNELVLLDEDIKEVDEENFPLDLVDEHGEQFDNRSVTSWITPIEEVPLAELMEVQIINSTVPFMLISQLTPLMERKDASDTWSSIVNVTSQEGSFNKKAESGYHVHTNMAKASLNMLTKSIATTYASKCIYVCGTDTGWCTLMMPKPIEGVSLSSAPAAPLSDRDGATRVLDPIYQCLTKVSQPAGVLFKNFKVEPW
eukprot:gene19699-23591_t